MIPNDGNINDLILTLNEESQSNTQTFGINMVDNIIGGKIDGLDALIQCIYLMLSIEADQYIIYPYTYGITTLDLIGKPIHYIMAILPERIQEVLLSDNRILDVTDFEFEKNKSKLGVKFRVHTIYGETQVETEVAY